MIQSFKNIDQYIFQAKFVRDYFLKHIDTPLEKTAIIPHFVLNHNLLNYHKKNYFLYAGRFSEEKGIIPLLNVFRSLPKIKLIVIGNGPLRREVEEYKRYKNITVVGFLLRNKISEYIQRAKAVIIPSLWYEVLPLVSLEALNQNVPILVPGSENFRLIFNNVQNSNRIHYYRFGNLDDLKNKIISLDQNKGQLMGVNTLGNNFNVENHYRILLELYLKVLHTG